MAFGPDGTRLYVHYRPDPSPLTVVFCDGIICDGFIYKYLWEDLTGAAAVAHFHYRGHGRSGLPADESRIDVTDHAADMNAVRSSLGDPPVVLVGHSVGTQVALEAYRARPSKVRGLVLLCGSPGRVTYTFHGTDVLATALPKLIELVTGYPRLFKGLWSRVPAKLATKVAVLTGEVNGQALRPEDLEPYFEHLAHVDPQLFLRMLERAGEHSAEQWLPEVGVPVLVIAGDRDVFTPPELSTQMAEQIPNARLVMLEGGTHVAPLEHRGVVAARIREFLDEVARPAVRES